jgi:hypothetical protein
VTAYHATHPEPVAPDCPQCGDPLTFNEPVTWTSGARSTFTVRADDAPCRWGWAVVAVVLLAAVAAAAWRRTR